MVSIRSHEPCFFRVSQTAEPSERYRERNRKVEQKERKKKKTEEKEAVQCGLPRACFRDDATGGCAVHDGDAVSRDCNLKSSQGRLLGPAKLRASRRTGGPREERGRETGEGEKDEKEL